MIITSGIVTSEFTTLQEMVRDKAVIAISISWRIYHLPNPPSIASVFESENISVSGIKMSVVVIVDIFNIEGDNTGKDIKFNLCRRIETQVGHKRA